MSIDRWTDTEIMVRIYNGILLSYRKECIQVSPNEVNEPRAYCMEWSKSLRERQVLCINVCEGFDMAFEVIPLAACGGWTGLEGDGDRGDQ